MDEIWSTFGWVWIERREKDETKDWKLIVRVKATSWWPDVAGINMLSCSSRCVKESFETPG